jgi:hypothetical protein
MSFSIIFPLGDSAMNQIQKLFNYCVLVFFVFAVGGCTKSIAPKDTYRFTPDYPQENSARNIAVDQTKDGLRITGNGITLLFSPPTKNSFKVDIDPEDAPLTMSIDSIPLDKSGAFYMKVLIKLGNESVLPAQIPMPSSSIFIPELYRPFPDALGSQNVTVKIDDQVGHTWYAGLKFHQETVCNVWDDGVVEVDREGIEAIDQNGIAWISEEVKIKNQIATIMVRK